MLSRGCRNSALGLDCAGVDDLKRNRQLNPVRRKIFKAVFARLLNVMTRGFLGAVLIALFDGANDAKVFDIGLTMP